MKKYIQFSLILISIFILCSCKTKEKYGLIEINSAELIENVLSDKQVDFIYALYNENNDNSADFIEDLRSVAAAIQTNIYYVDVNHIDVNSYTKLYYEGGLDTNINAYFAIKDKKVRASGEYSSYQLLYSSLATLDCKDEITRMSLEDKNKLLTEAKNAYENGNIVYSLDLLNQVWDLKEAKDYYQESKYFNILKQWEFYDFKNDKMTDLNYTSIIFYKDVNFLYQIEKRVKYNSDFTTPNLDEYEQLYYQIKNDIIYTSKKIDGNYKELYKIKYLDDKQLLLTRIKDQKEYKYILRS